MSLFLRAARGEDTPTAPIWIMRQAGRYLPEYRAIKEKHAFWEMARTPELAAEITLQPVTRFAMDAAILFSDIMTPLPPMGVRIDFQPGPVFAEPVRSAAAVEALRVPDGDELAPFVGDALRILRGASPVPVIGFAGAPLTLATYAVQGGGSKDFADFRGFLRADPATAHALLDKLTEVTVRYLRMQIASGADAVQLFDSWAGLHDERIYREFGMLYADRVLRALADSGVPRIYLAVDAAHLYGSIAELDCEVVSVDWRRPLSMLRPLLGGKTLQGNLDPAVLLADEDVLETEVERVLHEGLGGAHIVNLGHGIFPQTDPERVADLVHLVRQFDRRRAAWSDIGGDRRRRSRRASEEPR